MNTLAKEIFKPKLFSDQHERFEKEYPGFHQMIYDSMDEYAKAYAPVPGKEEVLLRALKIIDSPISHFQSQLKEGEVLNGLMAVQLSNDANWLRGVAHKALQDYAASPSTASNEDKAERAAKEYGEWQLCPKCNGDGKFKNSDHHKDYNYE